jgi:aspartate oxidase
LHDGEAIYYQGVEVEYVHGRNAVLTIYRDGQEQEQVTLSDYKTKDALHALMVNKGFIRRSNKEIEELMSWLQSEKEEASRRRFEEQQREQKWRREESRVIRASKQPISDMNFL